MLGYHYVEGFRQRYRNPSWEKRINMQIKTVDGKKTLDVRVVRTGDAYGLKDCMVHQEAMPMVEFYDPAFPEMGPRGQFISRYYADTLAEFPRHTILNLGMGYQVGPEALEVVLQMARVLLEEKRKVSCLTDEQIRRLSEAFKGLRVGGCRQRDMLTSLAPNDHEEVLYGGRTYRVTQYAAKVVGFYPTVGIRRIT